jgi:hypothetical protein
LVFFTVFLDNNVGVSGVESRVNWPEIVCLEAFTALPNFFASNGGRFGVYMTDNMRNANSISHSGQRERALY